jgi:hypothetical protein
MSLFSRLGSYNRDSDNFCRESPVFLGTVNKIKVRRTDDGVRMFNAVAIRHWAKRTGRLASCLSISAGILLGAACPPIASAQADSSAEAKPAPTTTQLSIAASEGDSRTGATFTVHVTGAGTSAVPAGSVSLKMGDQSLGSVVLDENGYATYKVDALAQGRQEVVATFNGSSTFAASTSPARPLDSTTSGLPDYTFTADKTALTIKVGQYGTVAVLVKPENNFNQIIGLSCAGLPLATTCKFTPAQLTPLADGKNTPLASTLIVQTTAITGGTAGSIQPVGGRPMYALVLPGILALVGLSATRKRLPALRMICIAVLLTVSGMSLSSCAARYDYYHHPPTVNKGTPIGTTTLTVYATSSSGNVATVKSLNVALNVTN